MRTESCRSNECHWNSTNQTSFLKNVIVCLAGAVANVTDRAFPTEAPLQMTFIALYNLYFVVYIV